MDEKIIVSLESYENYMSMLSNMQNKAECYAPTVKEIYMILEKDLREYLPFLIWIDDTGYDTQENHESRKLIRDIVNKRLDIRDEVEDGYDFGMNKKILASSDNYEKYMSMIDEMVFRAGSYAPTVQEIHTILEKDLMKYLPFLIWIDDTGYETEENKESRKLIREIVNKNLDIREEVENDYDFC